MSLRIPQRNVEIVKITPPVWGRWLTCDRLDPGMPNARLVRGLLSALKSGYDPIRVVDIFEVGPVTPQRLNMETFNFRALDTVSSSGDRGIFLESGSQHGMLTLIDRTKIPLGITDCRESAGYYDRDEKTRFIKTIYVEPTRIQTFRFSEGIDALGAFLNALLQGTQP